MKSIIVFYSEYQLTGKVLRPRIEKLHLVNLRAHPYEHTFMNTPL